jgi:tetratricopeptide (TPR) repeat protein
VGSEILDWLKTEDNREAVLALLALATALLGGGWYLYDRLFARRGADGPAQSVSVGGDAGTVQQVAERGIAVVAGAGAVVTVGYTIEQHEERLARREAELCAELGHAHAEEKAALVAQLDEVRRQKADVEASWAARKTELKRAAELLDTLAVGLPEVRLEAARRALDAGDIAKADALFSEVEAMEAAAIGRAAAAAFERGRLAEGQVRWADATGHYATAVRLAPSYDHLFAARAMAWRAGDYPAARRWGEDLLKSAVLEHGEDSPEHAVALSEHALTLRAAGRYVEAEPLYRRALAIDEKTFGTEHPEHATHLNNLANLLRAMGRYADAEPLIRQALAIDKKTLGTGHPDYSVTLNSLAGLLRATGRHAEAEPLYREALAIAEETLGKEHPTYATRLNNLAVLLRVTGRHADAEPLYQEALAISEKTLGKGHPNYAASLNNLAVLLQERGQYDEAESLYRKALAIDEKALGKQHPQYVEHFGNLADLLRKTGRSF